MSLVGNPAPAFTMPAVDGRGHDLTVNLADYGGRWLILFFYPHDFTFVCPTEITALSVHYDEFHRLDADILGVSTDSPHVHRAWLKTPVDAGGLGPLRYPLASDWTHQVSRAYGIYFPDEGAAFRGLFIIDPSGVVQYEVVHNMNVGRSIAEVQRVLQALQAGGLCPVDWEPGEALLTPTA
jgi:peroxiredoxin (alkyl hydroperoxide reductase subunit C)